ncbi:hypothetical protein J6590_002295 [Homalodisca vitripennis]|nr:hypothetical protein J6590_002295 [Homalodisca vitripennis]
MVAQSALERVTFLNYKRLKRKLREGWSGKINGVNVVFLYDKIGRKREKRWAEVCRGLTRECRSPRWGRDRRVTHSPTVSHRPATINVEVRHI